MFMNPQTDIPKFSSVSISITCYNDGATIGPLVDSCFEFLKTLTDDYEVFVVNDGSSDNSREVLAELGKKYPNFRAYHHERNLGFGAAFGRVYNNTSKEVNCMLPGDAQFTTEALAAMLPALKDHDLVLGYRHERADTWRRRTASHGYNFLVRVVSHHKVYDVNSISVYRTKLMDGVDLKAVSAFIHAEFFIKMLRNGARYVSVPIPHKKREAGRASGGRPDVMIKAAKEFWKYLRGGLN
jgi:glycosyltransferase involved in cell wall biosynthesis